MPGVFPSLDPLESDILQNQLTKEHFIAERGPVWHENHFSGNKLLLFVLCVCQQNTPSRLIILLTLKRNKTERADNVAEWVRCSGILSEHCLCLGQKAAKAWVSGTLPAMRGTQRESPSPGLCLPQHWPRQTEGHTRGWGTLWPPANCLHRSKFAFQDKSINLYKQEEMSKIVDTSDIRFISRIK